MLAYGIPLPFSVHSRHGAEKIDALSRNWLGKLPYPFTATGRKAGYRYQISILQAEFSFTQMK